MAFQKVACLMFVQSLRMTRRDWRAGELRFLLIALIIAVSALSSVSFFVDRMRTGLNRDANQLLGADLVIRSDEPLNAVWRNEAQRRGLQMAETVVFPSMAIAGEGDAVRTQLSSIKAVTATYPLRGNLRISDTPGSDGALTRDVPASGTVWVDPNLLTGLGVAPGASIKLGEIGRAHV